jgi:ribonuclease BN (tRNA processing enzyme)
MSADTGRAQGDFKVTVLGTSPAWTNPNGACSGYLVSCGSDNVLVECGSGVLGRVRARLALDELAGVVISHLHPDHFIDLVSLCYGLKYGGLRKGARLSLHAPPGAREYLSELGRVIEGDPRFFEDTYDLKEYDPALPLQIGSLVFRFREVKHYIPSYAMAIEAGRRLVFSGDAASCEALLELARGADLFLCEAGVDSREEDDPNPAQRGHMTAAEAADLARRAGVARLLLTHYRCNPGRNGHLLAEASAAFGGPTELAEEGRSYSV